MNPSKRKHEQIWCFGFFVRGVPEKNFLKFVQAYTLEEATMKVKQYIKRVSTLEIQVEIMAHIKMEKLEDLLKIKSFSIE